ncbi:hypothetical protein HanPSC8_Chr15g0663421 [Helianthus annuus]|nr:hypothetical protein HanPSC8_Chr15g0663421 [Helianthus annuus]
MLEVPLVLLFALLIKKYTHKHMETIFSKPSPQRQPALLLHLVEDRPSDTPPISIYTAKHTHTHTHT